MVVTMVVAISSITSCGGVPALDAKLIIFKKKRRKNYRRKKGHKESTKLRIIDIQGIEKPEIPIPAKTEKSVAKVEKAAVAA
ncbi:50S ribosomal protein L21, mitochondrial-like protein [Tanacetum coccineum]